MLEHIPEQISYRAVISPAQTFQFDSSVAHRHPRSLFHFYSSVAHRHPRSLSQFRSSVAWRHPHSLSYFCSSVACRHPRSLSYFCSSVAHRHPRSLFLSQLGNTHLCGIDQFCSGIPFTCTFAILKCMLFIINQIIFINTCT